MFIYLSNTNCTLLQLIIIHLQSQATVCVQHLFGFLIQVFAFLHVFINYLPRQLLADDAPTLNPAGQLLLNGPKL